MTVMSSAADDVAIERRKSLDSFYAKQAQRRKEEDMRTQWAVSLFTTQGVELPYDTCGVTQYITVHKDYPVDAEGNKDYSATLEIDVKATERILAKVVKHATKLGYKIEKNYDNDYFTVKVILLEGESKYSHIAINYRADRKVMCEKRVVGVKKVTHEVEEVEWDCKQVSFLGMATD